MYLMTSAVRIVLVGPSSSGKSFISCNLILQKDIMWLDPPQNILVCYSSWQEKYSELQRAFPNIRWSSSLPTMSDLTWLTNGDVKNPVHSLILIDDKINQVAKSSVVEDIYVTWSHHKNISILINVQNLFPKGNSWRTISLNSSVFFFLNSKRDVRQISMFASQIYGSRRERVRGFLIAFEHAIKTGCRYLYVDLSREAIFDHHLRSCIMPKEGPVRIYKLKH